MRQNRVTFGLRNVHYARVNNEDGVITFDAPKPIPGGVELSLEPRGDMFEFYADDMTYHASPNNQGYDGTVSIANVPYDFLIDILGEEFDDADGVLNEIVTAKANPFAFLFEFDGDVRRIRHVMYNCIANRLPIGSTTKTNTIEPNTTELSFVSSPINIDGKLMVKTKTTEETARSIYDSWFEKVYIKEHRSGQLVAADFIGVDESGEIVNH